MTRSIAKIRHVSYQYRVRTSHIYAGVLRVERVYDLAPSQPWTINPRTQALETCAPLTWTGVRTYHFADGPKRVLRRPEQVFAPKHLETLKMLSATQGHPQHRGSPVNLDGVNTPRFKVGSVGSTIEHRIIDGYQVPVGIVAVTSPRAKRLIEDGATQTSLGHVVLFDETGGGWDGPHGPERFDIEHICDPDDPRALAHAEETRDSKDPFDPESLGGNHFAVAIQRGRGGVLSELMTPARMVADEDADSLWTLDAPSYAALPRSPDTRGRCRVFMMRDAAGFAPDPQEEEELPVTEKTIQRVRLACDAAPNITARTVSITDEMAAQEIEAYLRDMSGQLTMLADKLTAVEGERDMAKEGMEAAKEGMEGAEKKAEEMEATAAKDMQKVQDAHDALETEVKKLRAVVNPSDELVKLRETAKSIHDAADYSTLDEESTKRAAVVGRGGDKYTSATVTVVDAIFEHFADSLGNGRPAPKRATAEPPRHTWRTQPTRDGAEQPRSHLDRINGRNPQAN